MKVARRLFVSIFACFSGCTMAKKHGHKIDLLWKFILLFDLHFIPRPPTLWRFAHTWTNTNIANTDALASLFKTRNKDTLKQNLQKNKTNLKLSTVATPIMSALWRNHQTKPRGRADACPRLWNPVTEMSKFAKSTSSAGGDLVYSFKIFRFDNNGLLAPPVRDFANILLQNKTNRATQTNDRARVRDKGSFS